MLHWSIGFTVIVGKPVPLAFQFAWMGDIKGKLENKEEKKGEITCVILDHFVVAAWTTVTVYCSDVNKYAYPCCLHRDVFRPLGEGGAVYILKTKTEDKCA